MQKYIDWIANYITADSDIFNEGIRHSYSPQNSDIPTDFEFYFDLDNTLANTDAELNEIKIKIERSKAKSYIELEEEDKREIKGDLLKNYAYTFIDKKLDYEEKSNIIYDIIAETLSEIPILKEASALWQKAYEVSGKVPKIRIQIPVDNWYQLSSGTVDPKLLKQAFIDGSTEWCKNNLNPAPASISIDTAVKNNVPNIQKAILVSNNFNRIDTWERAGGRVILHTNARSTLEGIEHVAGNLDFEIDLDKEEGVDTRGLKKAQKNKTYPYLYKHNQYNMGRVNIKDIPELATKEQSIEAVDANSIKVFYINEYGGNDKELMGWFKTKKTKNLDRLGDDVYDYLDDRTAIIKNFLDDYNILEDIRYIHIPESSSAISKTIANRLREMIYETVMEIGFYHDTTEEDDDLYGDPDYERYRKDVLKAAQDERNANRDLYLDQEKSAIGKALTVIEWKKISDPAYYKQWFDDLLKNNKQLRDYVIPPAGAKNKTSHYNSWLNQLYAFASGQLKLKEMHRNLRYNFTDFLKPKNLPKNIQPGIHLIIDDSLTQGGTIKTIAKYLRKNNQVKDIVGFTLYKNI